jgi:predicted enzyme related to lactoylglutathione lyase
MPRPVHFEIAASDIPKLKEFYSKVFGWTFQKWEGPQEYWVIKTGQGPGIDGGFMPRMEPGGLTVCTIDVASLDDSLKVVQEGGGTQVVPKMPIPGIGWLAYCKDPEGTIFGNMQVDKGAA